MVDSLCYMFSSYKKFSSSLICSSAHINSIWASLNDPIFHLGENKKTLNWRVEQTSRRKTNLKLIFPALRTLFSFQAFARSPRSKSRYVLHLKLPIKLKEKGGGWKQKLNCYTDSKLTGSNFL